MKLVVAILWICAVSCAITAVTGQNGGRFVGTEFIVTSHAGTALRWLAGVLTPIFGVAAYECMRRRALGWHLVHVLMWGAVIFFPVGLAMKIAAYSEDLPWPALLLGAFGECVKFGLGLWVLFRYWRPKRAEFSGASVQ